MSVEQPPHSADATINKPLPLDVMLEGAWRSVSVESLTADPPPIDYIETPRIPLGKVSVLSGTGGTGKTTFCTDLAARRALGLSSLDGAPLRRGETVFITGEDGSIDYDRKLAALRLAMGDAFDPEVIAGRIHILDVSGVPGVEMVRADFGQLLVTAVPDSVCDLIRRRAPRADWIVVETISRFGAGEGNDAHAFMVKAGERISKLTGAAVTLIGHVSQAAARAGVTDQFAARGGTALTDNARSALTLAHLGPENVAKYAPGSHLTEDEMGRFVVLTHPKSMGPKAQPMILEMVSNEFGAYFKIANLKCRGQQSEGARLGQLYFHVKRLNDSGIMCSEKKLRGKARDFGLNDHSMRDFVETAITSGVLVVDTSRKMQGGGNPLIPGSLTRHDQQDGEEEAA